MSGLYFPLVAGDGGLEGDQSTGPYGLYAAILHSTSPLHYTACIRVVGNCGGIKYMLYNDATKPRLVPIEEVEKFRNAVVLIYKLDKIEQRDKQGSDVAGIEAGSRIVCGSCVTEVLEAEVEAEAVVAVELEKPSEAGGNAVTESLALVVEAEAEVGVEADTEAQTDDAAEAVGGSDCVATGAVSRVMCSSASTAAAANAVHTFNGTPSIGQRGSHVISFTSMSEHDIMLVRSIRAIIAGPPIDASVFPLHGDRFYEDYLKEVAPSGKCLSIMLSTFRYIAGFLQFYATSSEGAGVLELGTSKLRGKYSIDVISLKHASLRDPTHAVFYRGSVGRISYGDATSRARLRLNMSGDIATGKAQELKDVGREGGMALVCSSDTEVGGGITNEENGIQDCDSAEDRHLAPAGTADGYGRPVCDSTCVSADDTGVVFPQKKLRTYSNGAPARLLVIINSARLSARHGTTYRSWVYELFSKLVTMSEAEPGFSLLLKLLADAEVCLQGAGGAGRDGALRMPLSDAMAILQESNFVAKLSLVSLRLTAVIAKMRLPARKTWAETFHSPTAAAAAGAAGTGAAVEGQAAVESCETLQREQTRKRQREESQYIELEQERKKEQARINNIDVATIESV